MQGQVLFMCLITFACGWIYEHFIIAIDIDTAKVQILVGPTKRESWYLQQKETGCFRAREEKLFWFFRYAYRQIWIDQVFYYLKNHFFLSQYKLLLLQSPFSFAFHPAFLLWKEVSKEEDTVCSVARAMRKTWNANVRKIQRKTPKSQFLFVFFDWNESR